MKEGRKERITASLRPEVVRLVAIQAEYRGMTRSEIVEQALEEWLERAEEEDRGASIRSEISGELERVADQLSRGVERLASLSLDNRRSTEMVYALLETAFKNASEVDRQKVRHRAIENMRADRKRKEEGKEE